MRVEASMYACQSSQRYHYMAVINQQLILLSLSKSIVTHQVTHRCARAKRDGKRGREEEGREEGHAGVLMVLT